MGTPFEGTCTVEVCRKRTADRFQDPAGVQEENCGQVSGSCRCAGRGIQWQKK
jgi:hypothetical protein